MVLAERISRSEPDVPSIDTALAHEHTITAEQENELHPDDAQGDVQPDRDHAPARGRDGYLTAGLGPRPNPGRPDRETWDHAAEVIESYRSLYHIPAGTDLLLGPEPPAGRFQQRHDRDQAARLARAAVRQLGPDHPQLAIEPEDRETGRDHGWEP